MHLSCGCGSSSNENAFKAAFILYMERRFGNSSLMQERLDSCMRNAAPGSPDLAMISFDGGFHGRTFGVLSSTYSKPIHKLDVPAFNWPMAPFPKIKYPYESFAKENREEENISL